MTTNRSTVTATKNITINWWQHPTIADKGSNSNWWQKIPPVTKCNNQLVVTKYQPVEKILPVTKVQQSTGSDKIATTGGVGDKSGK